MVGGYITIDDFFGDSLGDLIIKATPTYSGIIPGVFEALKNAYFINKPAYIKYSVLGVGSVVTLITIIYVVDSGGEHIVFLSEIPRLNNSIRFSVVVEPNDLCTISMEQ